MAATQPVDATQRISFLPKFGKVLILAPHTDDAELGCGGSICRLTSGGSDVYVVAFSGCEASLPPGSSPDRLVSEFFNATRVLGIPASYRKVLSLPVREFSYHRQEILDEMIRLRRELKPDAVFLPAGSDVHQDHEVIYREGIRAFKEVTTLGYELPWNHLSFRAQAFISLEVSHLERKWEALECYQSQLELKRPYFSWEFISGLARVRGVQAHEQYAEAFEVVRVKW